MAANTYYITAGLLVAKNSGQSPGSLVNTFYVTAGLPPEVLPGPAAAVGGPYKTEAGQIHIAGGQLGQLHTPGGLAGQVHIPGGQVGQIVVG